MLDDIANVQSRVQEIQATLSSLSGQPAAPAAVTVHPESAGGTPAPASFAQALHQAQGASAPEAPPAGPRGVRVPPASLGPLPPMPVSPTSPGVMPMPPSVSRAGDYGGLIQTYAAKHGLPPALVRAVIQTESGGNPHAVSRAGALGLMQLMPDNVKEAGIGDPFDPEQNISAGTQQLGGLLQKYHGDLNLALAGYNAGPGNVHRYGGVPPFAETHSYIRKVRAAMEHG